MTLPHLVYISRRVARGGAEFCRSDNPILTLFKAGWIDFAPHTPYSPPGFKKPSTPLISRVRVARKEYTALQWQSSFTSFIAFTCSVTSAVKMEGSNLIYGKMSLSPLGQVGQSWVHLACGQPRLLKLSG